MQIRCILDLLLLDFYFILKLLYPSKTSKIQYKSMVSYCNWWWRLPLQKHSTLVFYEFPIVSPCKKDNNGILIIFIDLLIVWLAQYNKLPSIITLKYIQNTNSMPPSWLALELSKRWFQAKVGHICKTHHI